MIRRSFFGAAFAAMATTLGLKAAELESEWKPLDTGPELRVWKATDSKDGFLNWKEIRWDDMQPGDRVLVFGVSPNVDPICDAYVVATAPEKTPSAGITVKHMRCLTKIAADLGRAAGRDAP